MLRSRRRLRVVVGIAIALGIVLAGMTYVTVQAAPRPFRAAEHKNMQLVGLDELQGRSAYQPTIFKYEGGLFDGHYIAFVGHHGGTSPVAPGNNGTSIVDVTDPRRPVYLIHIPGGSGVGEAGGAQMVRVCNGLGGTPGQDHVYMLRATATQHELYDVTNPGAPTLVTVVSGPFTATHKNEWEWSW